MESSKTKILNPKGYCVVCNRPIFTIPKGKSKSYIPKICDKPECRSAHSKRTREQTRLKRTSKKKDNINDPCKDRKKTMSPHLVNLLQITTRSVRPRQKTQSAYQIRFSTQMIFRSEDGPRSSVTGRIPTNSIHLPLAEHNFLMLIQ